MPQKVLRLCVSLFLKKMKTVLHHKILELPTMQGHNAGISSTKRYRERYIAVEHHEKLCLTNRGSWSMSICGRLRTASKNNPRFGRLTTE
ncbi:hypothetical protein MPTK1_6g15360 [Marchantia polymorpha subsp. ruderalis]|uniref:Uncharacterized protein n=2 Tax=Marchantia polymorpha TaxID=3197 RepID=A0AAF6BSA9_MARPO|nr:hypothetical protein MARPO_0056s0048 [Marchantia polymorpha]BBN14893.1 hypothetical protein Mp_6g15360 [Marchantia polymorpha subsp. ruderalis]|eukprot:PTQ37577.1 hypothetical protein MARPO_0056s0048 [Marchantia polymorpha]